VTWNVSGRKKKYAQNIKNPSVWLIHNMCKIITNKWGWGWGWGRQSDCLCSYSLLHSSDFYTAYKRIISLNSVTPCTYFIQHVCTCNEKPALNSAWFPCILALCNNPALGFPCIIAMCNNQALDFPCILVPQPVWTFLPT
jgi:hypothetical protein